MNIIEIENLTYSYPAAETPILKDITLQVEKGDFLAIVGNNGCGKSTFCKTLNGLIPHFITGEFSGKVVVDGVNTLESDVGTLAQKAGKRGPGPVRAGGPGGRLHLAAFRRADPFAGAGWGCVPAAGGADSG